MSETEASDDLLIHNADGVAWITFNRPKVKNALTQDQRRRLIDMLQDFSGDPAVRAVVLTGSEGSFCAGADLRTSAAPARPADAPDRIIGDVARGIRGGAQRMTSAILDCEKPVIAAVNGTAAGLGVALALACDLVIASEDAKFVQIFLQRGIVPDAGTVYLLTRLVGPLQAKRILLLGERLSAADAERLGLVSDVVPADRLMATAGEYAARLAAAPTRAVALTKWLVNRTADSDRTGSFDDEAIAQDLNMHSTDGQEGVQAFIDRREPVFKGW